MITKEELDAMQARCDAATPEPWAVNRRAELLDDEDIEDAEVCAYGDTILIALNSGGNHKGNVAFTAHARTDEPRLIARVRELEAEVSRYSLASDRSEWSEDDGDVLWWRFPIEEPPYAGTPLDDNFPDYVTHWTRIAIPVATQGATKPARLDADRTAKPLTEIVAVVAPNVDGVCRSPADSAERYVVRPTSARPARHEDCAARTSSTCIYLRDGTKVVVKRDGARAWLEHVPQATISVAGDEAQPPAERGQVYNVEYGRPGVEVFATPVQTVDTRHVGRTTTASLVAKSGKEKTHG